MTMDVCSLLTEIKKEVVLIRQFLTPAPEITGVVYKLINGHKVGYRPYGIWDEKRGDGWEVTYEHTETYAGTTLTLNLDFAYQTALKRIELMWQNADGSISTTAKDYELRVYSDFNNSSFYSIIKKETSNQDTSDIVMFGFVYPAGSRLQLYFSNYTAGKINKILVAIEEL